MRLSDELTRIAVVAAEYAQAEESVSSVIGAEPAAGGRLFLCSFEAESGRSWLVLDAAGEPVLSRALVRETVSIAALCELAGESAGGGHLEQLRAQLLELRITEAPEGIEEADAAALELERAIGAPPRLATPEYLDAVGAAARRLERALGDTGHSPFAAAMQTAVGAVEELIADVEAHYKLRLA